MGTLRKEMEDYMKIRGYSIKTIKLYTSCVKCFSYHFMKSPFDISYKESESFFLYLRNANKSEATIRLYYESVKFFYRMHNIKDRLPYITFPRLRNKLPVILCQNEIFSLLANCTSLKYRTIFTLIYSAGLRVSEATNLQLADIDFERKIICIRNGKNNKDRYTLLASETISLLRNYLQVYNPINFVFYSKDIYNKMSTDCIQHHFKLLVKENNVPKNIHVHTLRHCFATHLLENGTSIFYIMKLLGHSSIHTTMIYLHMQAIDKLNIISPIDSFRFESKNIDHSRKQQLELASA